MSSYLRSILLSLAVAVATTLLVLVVAYLSSPVTGIRVEGTSMYPESDAWEAVSEHASLLTLNEERLERKVEANPWVEGAEVTGNFESGIVTVQVKERRAVLDAEVEGERKALAVDGTELPGLGGAGLSRVELDEDQLGDVLRFGRVLRENGLEMGALEEANAAGFEATVEGRRVVFSGDVSAEQARALREVMESHPGASTLDLRSPERVVVAAGADDGAEG
ncbi:MAG: hypothetical protein AVDCRST_MAG02-2852 [uncultured Rubrobacteraceae bacterium]|uniref:POTRA domain-containing protein n=1 Tax=uncultured Rubrobacteraceae bacterium TaxID=349277 RepID=A0A6J4R6G8_9ACTN|nr:MAG: hypothetical protein AVDCRST_MAG02-2852 [uncultured Rubrobacteraceae bacterium]